MVSRCQKTGKTLVTVQTRFILSFLLFTGLVILTAGCAVGPDFVKPEAPVGDAWLGADMPGIASGSADYRTWWKVFDDPILDGLVERARTQNLPLQIAGLRILETRAQLGIAVGNLYPQQQAGFGEYAANRLSKSTGTPVADRNFQSLSTGFDAAWEIDFWGKFRRSVESGTAVLEAAIAGYDDVLVLLTSEVARTYIVMRTLERRLQIARQNVRIQERSLAIADARFKGGDVSELDVTQARSLLRDTQALIPGIERALRQAQNAMALLLGSLPADIEAFIQGNPRIPQVPDTVVVDIPVELLRRRPDIRLAERQVAAQSARIGVAKADLYPHFALFGTIGWQSADLRTPGLNNGLDDIFTSRSLFWTAGPSFTWNFLNYGRIRNQVRVEDARLQQFVVAYQDTVLRACREVEDAIAGFVGFQEEAQLLAESVAAARRSVDISLLQYREGIADFQRVLDTQRFLSGQSDRLAVVNGSVATDLVALYKALGGGWQVGAGKAFISSQNRQDMLQRTNWGDLLPAEPSEPPLPPENETGWHRPDW